MGWLSDKWSDVKDLVNNPIINPHAAVGKAIDSATGISYDQQLAAGAIGGTAAAAGAFGGGAAGAGAGGAAGGTAGGAGGFAAYGPTLVGAGLGLYGAKKSGDAQVEAARIAAEASRFTPYNVNLPGGSASFNTQTGTATGMLDPQMQAFQDQFYGQAQGYFGGGAQIDPRLQAAQGQLYNQLGQGFQGGLSPEMQGLQNQYFQQAQQGMGGQAGYEADLLNQENLRRASQGAFDAFGSYDPAQAAQEQYGRLEAIAKPGETRRQDATQAQLFKRGILGATAGKNVLESEATAREMRSLARESQAFGQAQSVQDSLFNRAVGAGQAGEQNRFAAAGLGENLRAGQFGRGMQAGQGALGLGAFGEQLQQGALNRFGQTAQLGLGIDAAQQGLEDRQLAQGYQALGAGRALNQDATQALQLGANIGGRATQANQAGAAYNWQAALNKSDATAAFWGNLGEGVAGGLGGGQGMMAGGYMPQQNSNPYSMPGAFAGTPQNDYLGITGTRPQLGVR